MSTVMRIVLGIVVGVLLSLMTMVIALAGLRVVTGLAVVSTVAAVISMLGGAVLGAVGVALGHLTAGRERSMLVLLIGLALAALAVMLGRYGDGSMYPLGIYSLAVVNSLMISRATSVLAHNPQNINRPNLGG